MWEGVHLTIALIQGKVADFQLFIIMCKKVPRRGALNLVMGVCVWL